MTRIPAKKGYVPTFLHFRPLSIIAFQTEFEDTILEDLLLLGIKGDIITHTSDYFATLYDYALKVIKEGKAYTDDTEQAQVRTL